MLKIKRNIKIGVLVSWLSVLLWMIFIFSLSAQPATESSALSSRTTRIIIQIIDKIIPLDIESSTTADFALQAEHIVRKVAHGIVYFILGILVMVAFIKSEAKGFKAVFLSLMLCILYACSDELHQLFISGRSGQLKDVLIDSIGASIGIVICQLIRKAMILYVSVKYSPH